MRKELIMSQKDTALKVDTLMHKLEKLSMKHGKKMQRAMKEDIGKTSMTLSVKPKKN